MIFIIFAFVLVFSNNGTINTDLLSDSNLSSLTYFIYLFASYHFHSSHHKIWWTIKLDEQSKTKPTNDEVELKDNNKFTNIAKQIKLKEKYIRKVTDLDLSRQPSNGKSYHNNFAKLSCLRRWIFMDLILKYNFRQNWDHCHSHNEWYSANRTKKYYLQCNGTPC